MSKKVETELYSERLGEDMLTRIAPRFIVSYNYKYIVSENIIKKMQGRIINLHTSLLPWNRGSSPNVWSFIDNTPKGVTIHVLEKGLDTGGILWQREVSFDEGTETLATTYKKLNDTLVELFKEHWEELYRLDWHPVPQKGKGSFHTKKDLESFLGGKKLDFDLPLRDFRKTLRNYKCCTNCSRYLP